MEATISAAARDHVGSPRQKVVGLCPVDFYERLGVRREATRLNVDPQAGSKFAAVVIRLGNLIFGLLLLRWCRVVGEALVLHVPGTG